MRTLIDGAAYLFCNEYEEAVIEQKTGWTAGEVLSHVDTRIITLGADGARVERAGQPAIVVPGIATPSSSSRPARATRSAPASSPPWPGACPCSARSSSAT